MRPAAILSCLVGSLLFPLVAGASDISFEGSLGTYSSYVWRGYRISGDALQLQPSATLSFSGVSLNIWADYDSQSDEWLEVDYTASYEKSTDRFDFGFGVAHYDVRNGPDSDEVYVTAEYEGLVRPSVAIYYDFNQGNGAFVIAGLSREIAIRPDASLDFSATMGLVMDDSYVATTAQELEFTGWFNGELAAAANISLGKGFSLEPRIGYTFALSDRASAAIKAGSETASSSFLYGSLTVGLEL